MLPVDVKILPFRVSGREFGIPATRVVGVVRDIPDPTQLRDVHILDFFGEEVPVFPAGELFGMPMDSALTTGEVILLRSGQSLFGVRVDSTDAILTATLQEQIYPNPPLVTEATGRKTLGTAEVGSRRLVLIDFERPVLQ